RPGAPPRCGPTLPEGEAPGRHKMPPLARTRRAPGELDPSNVVFSNRRLQRRDQLLWSDHEQIESLTISLNKLCVRETVRSSRRGGPDRPETDLTRARARPRLTRSRGGGRS